MLTRIVYGAFDLQYEVSMFLEMNGSVLGRRETEGGRGVNLNQVRPLLRQLSQDGSLDSIYRDQARELLESAGVDSYWERSQAIYSFLDALTKLGSVQKWDDAKVERLEALGAKRLGNEDWFWDSLIRFGYISTSSSGAFGSLEYLEKMKPYFNEFLEHPSRESAEAIFAQDFRFEYLAPVFSKLLARDSADANLEYVYSVFVRFLDTEARESLLNKPLFRVLMAGLDPEFVPSRSGNSKNSLSAAGINNISGFLGFLKEKDKLDQFINIFWGVKDWSNSCTQIRSLSNFFRSVPADKRTDLITQLGTRLHDVFGVDAAKRLGIESPHPPEPSPPVISEADIREANLQYRDACKNFIEFLIANAPKHGATSLGQGIGRGIVIKQVRGAISDTETINTLAELQAKLNFKEEPVIISLVAYNPENRLTSSGRLEITLAREQDLSLELIQRRTGVMKQIQELVTEDGFSLLVQEADKQETNYFNKARELLNLVIQKNQVTPIDFRIANSFSDSRINTLDELSAFLKEHPEAYLEISDEKDSAKTAQRLVLEVHDKASSGRRLMANQLVKKTNKLEQIQTLLDQGAFIKGMASEIRPATDAPRAEIISPETFKKKSENFVEALIQRSANRVVRFPDDVKILVNSHLPVLKNIRNLEELKDKIARRSLFISAASIENGVLKLTLKAASSAIKASDRRTILETINQWSALKQM